MFRGYKISQLSGATTATTTTSTATTNDNNNNNNKQEARGPRYAHLVKTATDYLQMPCNIATATRTLIVP